MNPLSAYENGEHIAVDYNDPASIAMEREEQDAPPLKKQYALRISPQFQRDVAAIVLKLDARSYAAVARVHGCSRQRVGFLVSRFCKRTGLPLPFPNRRKKGATPRTVDAAPLVCTK